eukprot:624288_1
MAQIDTCSHCSTPSDETEEKKLFTCPVPNCRSNSKGTLRLCMTCGVNSHRNQRIYNHEFGGQMRYDGQIQNTFENAVLAHRTSTSKTAHASTHGVGNAAVNTVVSVAKHGKAVFKISKGFKGIPKAMKGFSKGLAKGAVAVNVVLCVVECGNEIRRCRAGIISEKECQRLITRSLSANSVSFGAALGGAAFGGAIAGPPGAIIGGVVGAVGGDLVTRAVFDKWVWSNEEQKERESEINNALLMFQYIGVKLDDIWRENSFTRDKLESRYHRLALETHPDRVCGSIDKFNTVLNRYNILLGVLEEKEKRNR